MERKLEHGEYVPDGSGGLVSLTGREELLQRVLFRLKARRGGLTFLPELGSRLYELLREKPSARTALATQYVAQALKDEQDLKVTAVELGQVIDGKMELVVRLEWQGEPLGVTVVLGEE